VIGRLLEQEKLSTDHDLFGTGELFIERKGNPGRRAWSEIEEKMDTGSQSPDGRNLPIRRKLEAGYVRENTKRWKSTRHDAQYSLPLL